MDIQTLQNFRLPDGAYEAIAKQQRESRPASTELSGVEMYSGHTKGVPYRFFVHQEKNETRSKIARVELFDDEEMVEWIIDRGNIIPEKVRFLPPELLELDVDGEPIGGIFLENYKRWREGLSAPGTSIKRWGVPTDSQIATLTARKIFTVEQFAAMPRTKVQTVFGGAPEFVELFEKAIQFVNSQQGKYEVEEHVKEILSLKEKEEKQAERIKILEAHVQNLLSKGSEIKIEEAPRGRGRPRKEVSADLDINLE